MIGGREYMKDLSSTQFFQVESGPQIQFRQKIFLRLCTRL